MGTFTSRYKHEKSGIRRGFAPDTIVFFPVSYASASTNIKRCTRCKRLGKRVMAVTFFFFGKFNSRTFDVRDRSVHARKKGNHFSCNSFLSQGAETPEGMIPIDFDIARTRSTTLRMRTFPFYTDVNARCKKFRA